MVNGKTTNSQTVLILLFLLVLVALSRYLLYFYDNFAVGLDGYFYALQIKYVVSYGATLYPDASIAYGFLAIIARVFGCDPVVATKLGGIFAAMASTGLFIVLAKNLGFKPIAIVFTGVFFGLSRTQLFFDLEFIKNALGMVPLFSLFLVLYWVPLKPQAKIARWFFIVFCLGLCLSLHRLAFFLGLILVASQGFSFITGQTKPRNRVGYGIILFCAICIPFLFLLLSKNPNFDRLGQIISLNGLSDRVSAFLNSHASRGEIVEFIFLHIAPFGLLALLVRQLRKRTWESARFQFLLVQTILGLVLVFPFYTWSFDGFAFRFLLMAWIPASALLLFMAEWLLQKTGKFGVSIEIALVILLIIPLSFDAENLHKSGRYPDYQRSLSMVQKLKQVMPPGYKLVAKSGIAAMIWYYNDIPTITFSPRGEDGKWLRLVFAYSTQLMAKYLIPGDFSPIPLGDSYTLVDEKTWDRFYADKKGVFHYLESPDNPNQPRPAFSMRYRPEFVQN